MSTTFPVAPEGAQAPVISPKETPASVTDRIAGVAMREKTHLWWWGLFALALAMLAWGGVSVGVLFSDGIEVWGNDWPVMWGFPIINYVWWIGIASGGTLISSLFYITRAKWRPAVSRIAETVTLFAAACACNLANFAGSMVMIVVDRGRRRARAPSPAPRGGPPRRARWARDRARAR